MALAAQSIMDLPRRGILLMLAAWGLFSLVDTSAKWLGLAGMAAFQLAFMRYAGHFAMSLAMLARGGLTRARLQTDHPWQLISRSFLLVSATLSNFYALQFLPLAVVSAIIFSSPVIVCFLSVTVLREKVGLWRWFAILLGFIGVLIVVRPFGVAFHPAMLLILYNATALALYAIMTRQLAGKVATDTMQFYMGAVGMIVLLPGAIWTWQGPQNATELALLLSIGPLAWAGHQMLIRAHHFGTANQLMPFTYSFLIYMALLGYLVFGAAPDRGALMGALVIMGAGLIIWKREQR